MEHFDIMNPEVRANPYPFYARLRREPGVHRIEPTGHYLVARYADVVEAIRRVDDFSSLEMAKQIGPITTLTDLLGVSLADLPPTIISSDNPTHDRLRHILSNRFTPRAVAGVEEGVRRLTDSLVGRLESDGEFDLVRDFTVPLPVIVIAQMLGIEEDRYEDFKRWSDALVRIVGSHGAERERYQGEMLELVRYLMEAAERRRIEPGDDLVSVLVQAAEDPARISGAEVLAYLVLLLVAGNETTTNLIGGMVEALLDNPAELAKLAGERSLLQGAVEEGLRLCSPVQGLFRNATHDTVLAGERIPAGAPMMICYASANHDETQFADPERFDVTRDTRGHVAFGLGLHFCLGAHLARREARAAIERLLPLLPRLRRVREEREYVDSWFLRGPKVLQLRSL